MTTQIEAPAMTLADLERFLGGLGFPLEEVREVGIVAGERGIRESGLFLRIVRPLLNHEGERFGIRMPDDSVQIACEAILIPLTSLSVDANAPRTVTPLAYDAGVRDQPSEAEGRFLVEQRLEDLKSGRRVLRPQRVPDDKDEFIAELIQELRTRRES